MTLQSTKELISKSLNVLPFSCQAVEALALNMTSVISPLNTLVGNDLNSMNIQKFANYKEFWLVRWLPSARFLCPSSIGWMTANMRLCSRSLTGDDKLRSDSVTAIINFKSFLEGITIC
jgi:hypothetical protein